MEKKCFSFTCILRKDSAFSFNIFFDMVLMMMPFSVFVSIGTMYIIIQRSGEALRLRNTLGFLLNGAEFSMNSVNSEKIINHPTMNWAQFKDPMSHMCLAGTVVACWPLTQEWVAGSSPF